MESYPGRCPGLFAVGLSGRTLADGEREWRRKRGMEAEGGNGAEGWNGAEGGHGAKEMNRRKGREGWERRGEREENKRGC